jgi:hypothetical protein
MNCACEQPSGHLEKQHRCVYQGTQEGSSAQVYEGAAVLDHVRSSCFHAAGEQPCTDIDQIALLALCS